MSEVKLNDKQKEAVEWSAGPLLVLAGPGTGKTQLLSARVERILKETDANPENILCLTFTESGAANMRERLARSIGLAARKVNIHTYHAFGATILTAYQNYNDHFLRRLDAAIDEVTQYKILAGIQKKLPARDILRGDKVNDILSTIANAKAARLTATDLRAVAEQNICQSAELSSEITPVMQEIEPRMKFEAASAIYQEILEILVRHTSPKEIAARVEPIANILARELKKVLDEQMAAERPTVSALTKWRNSYFERDARGEWRLTDYTANRKLSSLANVMEKYEEELAAAGLYDFSDMIEMAIKALREDRGFRLSMSERFQHILLDEFQDTNPSQFELIKLLCDYEKPDVMAVGDDDQAIYEFQGANASNLYDFQVHFGAHLVNLEQNYRSYGEIIDTAKRVAEGIEGSFSRKSGVMKSLKATRESAEVLSLAPVSRHEFISSDAEYYWVAERIAELVKAGVSQNDIAVIMPKHRNIAPLLPYLKTHPEVNVAYEKRDNLLLDPKIAELMVLARFIMRLAEAKPAAGALLEILAFPFWGVEPLTAIRAVNAARADKKAALDYLAEAEDENLRRLAEFLATLAMKSFDTPLELMLDYMIGTAPIKLKNAEFRSPFLKFYAGSAGDYASFELYENLATFREQLMRHTKTVAPRLKDLVQFCDDYEAAGAALMNNSPYREADEAVQILTAHKSKGLEFKYVFMMSVDSQAWGRAKGNNNMLSLPKNLLQIRHTGMTDDERRRLLFVAMTRARDYLLMTNARHDFAGKSPERLEYLEEQTLDDGAAISPFLPSGAREIQLHYDDIEAAAKQGNLQTYWSAAYLKKEPELRRLLLERMRDYRLSATDLTTFVDIAYAGPMEFFRRKVLRAPQEAATESLEYGNLVHAVFEKVTTEGISDEEALSLFASETEKCDLEAEERRVLLEKGSYALTIALREFGSILRSPRARAEVALGSSHPVFHDVPLTGKLDHIEVDKENRRVEIYDFKTGNYHDKGWGSHATLFKYALQLSFYRALLLSSPEYAGYEVARAHILFVTPDEDDQVHDKVYDFDLDEEWLAELMAAVYQEATSLAFLDDAELAVEPDSGRGLKAIREFIALLLDKNKKV